MTALAALALALASAARPTTDRPNVVLIVADDLGYADLGCYKAADIATPHLDRLAAQGTRFTDFSVNQAVCTASRASLLTGQYANRVGMAGALNHTSRTGLAATEPTLAERLKARGYATACFGKWHLGDRPPFRPTRRGFDRFFGLPYSNDNGPLHPVARGLPPLPLYDGDRVAETDPDQSAFTRRLTERAVGFVADNRARPFFLYLPHVMPHIPIFASERFRGSGGRGLYGDVMRELDWGVGEVLAALDRHGLTGNTLVAFLSDNGPNLSYGDHAGSAGPFRGGKLTAFEGGVRVPLVVRWPGAVPAGRVCEELVTSLDLHAVLCRAAGADPGRTDGHDLTPLFRGAPGATGRDRFWLYSGDELHAVREGKWKLHLPHDYLTVAGEPGRGGKPANFAAMKPAAIEQSGVRGVASRHGYSVARTDRVLYDLRADPAETTDVAAAHPEVVARLEAEAEVARAELGDALTGRTGRGVRPPGRD